MKATAERLETRPELIIGWLVASDLRDPELLEIYARARSLLTEQLREQFPLFDWQMPQIERRNFAPRGSLKPLNLLEMGSEERLFQRWDYALVVVPNELQPRRRISALGVPSSALEVAALSSARLGRKDEDLAERLAALAQHLLGQPLIYLNDSRQFTLALGLAEFTGLYTSQWHLLMAAATVVIAPVVIAPVLVLFFFAQRYFIEGIALTGTKG